MKAYEKLVTFETMLTGYADAINRFDAAADKNVHGLAMTGAQAGIA